MRIGKLKTTPIARRQRLWFTLSAAMPDRPHRMKNVASRQAVALREFGLAGPTASKLPACVEQVRTRGTENRALTIASTRNVVMSA